MKKFVLLLLLCSSVFILSGCAGFKRDAAVENTVPVKKIKTGFYIDAGSRGGGVLHLARLLCYSPQLDVTFLHGEDLRNGKLKDLDLLVMPGGSSKTQMFSMGEKGVEALREFIRNGGAYIGVCAGFHITLNRPERARIFPYTYVPEAVGYKAQVYMDLSDDGAKVMNVKAGRYYVTYSRGPVAREGKWEQGKCRTLGVYKSSVGPVNRAGVSFFNTPALIYGNFGKGKVIATSFHPEYRPETRDLFYGCVYAVTGTKIMPVFPAKKFHPLRVAYYNEAAVRKGNRFAIKDMFELEKSPEIGLQLGMNQAVLENSDILVLPDTTPKAWEYLVKNDYSPMIKKFLANGGKVVAVGSGWNRMPAYKNLLRVPAGASLVDAVLRVAGK